MNKQPTGTRSIRRCRVSRAILVLLAGATGSAAATGARDPEFARFPLGKWLAEGRQAQIRWSVIIPPADLSTHQRMILRVTARVDGRELEKRRNAGRFVGLIEYADGSGHVWQNHVDIDPAKLQAAMQRQYLDIGFYAFVLPGDYTIALAVCDPKTMEHSAAIRKVHVAALKNDPVPDAWAGLPAVDIITGGLDPPDVWYLQDVRSRLSLPLETKRPLHVQLLLNTTPSGKTEGSAAALRENMSVLVPAMKILSEMQIRNGSTDAAMLDLTHRRVVFEHKNVVDLNWDSMRKFFEEAKPGVIDIHALADRRKMLAFFADEVNRRLAPRKDGAAQVVIVLSGPAFFEDQEPAAAPKEPLDANSQLIYIRYRTALPQRRYPPGGRRPTAYSRFPVAPRGSPGQEVFIPPMPEDDLEKTAEPLNARLFDAASAMQFRRILAAVREQLSRM